MEIATTDRQQFDDLCRELNLDDATAKKAWESYESIQLNYTLEGDCLTWLTCAVYAACRQIITPTVNNGTMEGNCTSLTRLLKYSKLSVVQFFSKMKNWSDMANLPRKVCDKVDRLERNFAVSTVIFKKYQPIFMSIFKKSSEEPRPPRSRKQRRPPCTSQEVFAFCWDLFVLAKGNFPAISDDLVNSYHLLLCCVDLLFGNAVLADRRNLLRADFEGLPDDFHSDTYQPPSTPPCIIEQLCKVHEGLVIEAKGIKEHFWKPYLTKLMEIQFSPYSNQTYRVLNGNIDNLSGLLDSMHFETNCKNVKREYDEYVLKKGDFDERIFLDDNAHEQIGTPSRSAAMLEAGEMAQKVSARRALRLDKHSKDLIPQTPLTNRRYLKEKETHITPVSTATQTVSRLQALLSGQKNCPSEELVKVFESCKENPAEDIAERVKTMGETFCQKYTQPSDHGTGSPIDFAKRRLALAESLYFSVLAKIIDREKQRLPDNHDLSGLLGHDKFHSSLFACCLEIIIFAYNSQRVFPWILEIFNLKGYYFYRVIELLLRAEDGLPRDIVKHLNRTEEVILQERAWSSDSPLWKALEEDGGGVPMCADCTPANQVEAASPTQGSVMPQTLLSPMQHRRVQELGGGHANRDPMMSPTSAHDRFNSPAPGSAKRRLFTDDTTPSSQPASSATPVTVITEPANTPSVQAKEKAAVSQSLPGTPSKSGSNVGGTINSAPSTPLKTQTVILTIKDKDGNIRTIHSPIRLAEPGQKLLLVTANTSSGAAAVIPQPKNEGSQTTEKPPESTYVKPKRSGSLGMFFRKVYHLLNIRVRDLCAKLGISEELRRKIWTCLEHSLVHHADMMKDRHLDQLLLCAFYIICKVTGHCHSFQDIIKSYRRQPQAVSHTYRSVLLCGKSNQEKAAPESGRETSLPTTPEKQKEKVTRRSAGKKTSSAPPTPTRMSGTSTSFENEERGDLVAFYNKVYIGQMNEFATKFQVGRDSSQGNIKEPPLSPLPRMRTHLVSPRKVSRKHELYVSPHKQASGNGSSASPTKVMKYYIQKSPSKNLHDINRMLKTREKVHNKRVLKLDGSESPSKRSRTENSSSGSLARKLQNLQQRDPQGI
ncbi:Retinoblastoma-like protein 1 [Holothuria leucospilota]|uniref:Retinoblastoma-like protein 1 n=1 Tax=Holothuria leucospilota TaxID=206669 RepID=A0A9Q1CBU2_HOLLE|nr:Retinoblastoma-like protein 1 [Holothuria leucospilota]